MVNIAYDEVARRAEGAAATFSGVGSRGNRKEWMMILYKAIARPIIFRASARDPEYAHHWIMSGLAQASRHQWLLKIIEAANAYRSAALERDLFGLHFPNPLGLAGGFDKNGLGLPALAALGFGFIEAGTVTRYRQSGNERPRNFRFAREHALINRMGFPNDGADAIHDRLLSLPKPALPIGWSLEDQR